MLSTEAGSRHYPASDMRPEADPVPLELAEWRLEGGCWPPKPVKQNISRQDDKRVGSVAACHWRPTLQMTLSYSVGEGRLADQLLLASGGPSVGRWCYVCRVGSSSLL